MTLICTIISLAHSLQRPVVDEGVEAEEHTQVFAIVALRSGAIFRHAIAASRTRYTAAIEYTFN